MQDNAILGGKMKEKRINYQTPIGNVFELKDMMGKYALSLENELFTGKLILEYDNGNLHSSGIIKNGFKHKEWITYYESGEVRIKELFTANLRQGKYLEYHKNGKISVKGLFLNGMKTESWKWYHENGVLKMIGSYIAGNKTGEYKEYSENGKLIRIAQFLDNKEHGEGIWYYESGKLKGKRLFMFGDSHGEQRIYYENGNLKSVGEYIRDERVGEWKEYYENGNLKIISNWTNSRQNGKAYEYYESGGMKAAANYHRGRQHGETAFFHKNGNKRKVEMYNNNTLDGKSYVYDEEGNLEKELFYKNGKINGLVTAYYLTGKVKYKVYYKMGVIYGEYEAFDKNGNCTERGFIDEMNNIFDIKAIEIKKEIKKKERAVIKNIETRKREKEKVTIREDKKEINYYKSIIQPEEPKQNIRTEGSPFLRYDEVLELREKNKKALGIIDFNDWRDMFDLINEIKGYIENRDMERAVNKILILSNIDKQLAENNSAVKKNLSVLLKETSRFFMVKSKDFEEYWGFFEGKEKLKAEFVKSIEDLKEKCGIVG